MVKSIYLKNAMILTMNDQNQVYERGDILINGDRIQAVGKVDPVTIPLGAEIFDARGSMSFQG